MQRHAVSYAAHGMFSDPVVELSPFRLARGESFSVQIRPRIASQISRPGEQRGDYVHQCVNNVVVRVTGRD